MSVRFIQHQSFPITLGVMLLLVVVTMWVLYRAHVSGVLEIAALQPTVGMGQGEDEFMTEVRYQSAFASALEEPPENNASTQLANVLKASRANQFLSASGLTQNFVSPDEYQPQILEWIAITDLSDTATLWATPEVVVDTSEDRRTLGYSGQRKVVVDQAGDIHVAYRRKYNDTYQIFLSTLELVSEEGYVLATAEQPLSLRTLGITQRVPSVVVDGRGLLHVVWYGSGTSDYPNRRQIFHAQSKGSANFWEENELISYVEGYDSEFDYWQEHPTVVLGEYDDLFAAWEGKDADNDKQQIKFSQSFNGGQNWTEWQNILPAEDYTYSRPALLYTNDDRTLHLFAYSSEGVVNESTQIQYTYSTDFGASWEPWRVVSPGVHDARHISVTSKDNTPYIAYRTRRNEDGPSQIMIQRIEKETIGTAVPIAPSDNYQFFPSISNIEDSSLVCVSWIEEDTSSEFPNEDPTDGDIYLACNDVRSTTPAATVFNLTPSGSHLYPNLLRQASAYQMPIVYYDDDADEITLRVLRLTQPN